MQKTPPPPQLAAAIAHHRAGRVREAEVAYRQILVEQPNNADSLYLLGLIESQSGRREQAIELFRRAARIVPRNADIHRNLGLLLESLGRFGEALAPLQTAVQLNPQHDQHHYDLGNLLLQMQHFDEAIAELQTTVAINPGFASAHQNLGWRASPQGFAGPGGGTLAAGAGNSTDDGRCLQQSRRSAHRRMRLAEAKDAYEQALKIRPDFATAMANLGSVLRMRGSLSDAIRILRRAIELAPNLPEAFNNLGIALKENGQLDEAVMTYRKCLSLRPSMGDATNNLGNAYKDCGNVRDAVACYGRSLVIGFANSGVHSNLVYTLQFHPGYDDGSLFREQRRWNEIYAAPLKHLIRKHDNDRSPDRKLRIGYVSPYFYNQAESFFVLPLLRNHHREQVEVHCYASVIRPDAMTQKMQATAECWHDVLGVSDSDLAEQIRRDRIDVVIDLAMHMAHNRMIAFAHKPAPVQAAWRRIPAGPVSMPWIIASPMRTWILWIRPTAYYREQSLPPARIAGAAMIRADTCPGGNAASRSPDSVSDPSTIPANTTTRPSPFGPKSWAACPIPRLLMQAFSESDRQQIRSTFQNSGVAPERIEFVPRRLRLDYLRFYDSIDICLDPLPYNGITTTCDALWMGVPVVTLVEKTAAGRAGVSILSTIGMPEMIAHNEQQFVEIATTLANDAPRLAELRATLRDRTEKSPLMDGLGFARKMETAYRQMWRRWCESE